MRLLKYIYVYIGKRNIHDILITESNKEEMQVYRVFKQSVYY